MSSARMAGSPELGACKPSGETWEVKNLFVADGSSMPTATGVNPMMSIMATAHYIAQEVKAALN
jgi:long-chain-alcohol oxidase